MDNVINDEQAKEKYRNFLFSSEGFTTLETYIKQMLTWYMDGEMKYPFTQGIILGLPLMDFSSTIYSRELLRERILIVATLLGKQEFDVMLDSTNVTIDIRAI